MIRYARRLAIWALLFAVLGDVFSGAAFISGFFDDTRGYGPSGDPSSLTRILGTLALWPEMACGRGSPFLNFDSCDSLTWSLADSYGVYTYLFGLPAIGWALLGTCIGFWKMRSTRATYGDKNPTRSIVRCVAAAALFAAAVPASKTLLAGIGPFTLAGLLYLGAAIAVLPKGRTVALIRLSRANLVRVAGVAVFGGIIAPVLMLVGLTIAPAASVSLWLNLEVVATALIAIWYFSDHLDGRGWIGVVLIALAGVLLAAPRAFSSFPAAVLVAAACVCWSIDNNLTAVIDELTPSQTTLIKGLVGAAVNLTLGFALGVAPLRVEIAAIGIGVGALSYGASLSLYISASQELGAARTQALFASAPLIGCALSWLTLGEQVRAEQIGAAIITVVGGLLLFSRHQHEHFHLAVVHTHEHSHDDAHHLQAHDSPVGRHSHEHSHEPIAHDHEHVPDLHHRHGHSNR